MVLVTLEPTASMKCTQYILLAFNAIFTFTGIILISVGSMVNTINEDFAQFIESRFFSPPVLIIGIGFLVFVIASFGCYGAYKLSVAATMLYSLLLAFIFILELGVGLACYLMQDEIGTMIFTQMNKTMSEYKTDPIAARAIDDLQYGFYCCGIRGPEDWENLIGSVEPELGIAIPLSCCAFMEHNECSAIKRTGCLSQLKFLIGQNSLLLTSTVFMIALMQLLGVVFAHKLARELRQQKSERDRFRWQIKENVANNFGEKQTEYQQEYSPLPNYTELYPSNEEVMK